MLTCGWTPMADVDPIRAALVEAVRAELAAHGWSISDQSACKCGVLMVGIGLSGDAVQEGMERHQAEAALSVVESWQPLKPCPECGGRPYVTEEHRRVGNDDWETVIVERPCPTCGGSGSIKGEPVLKWPE